MNSTTDDPTPQGYYIEPTIITGVSDDSVLMTEEIFGPVLLVNTFTTDEEVLARANNTEYGLYSEFGLIKITFCHKIYSAYQVPYIRQTWNEH